MSKQNEAGKRDFVSQVISLSTESAELLIAKGFDPAAKIELLTNKKQIADKAETAQQEAAAAAKVATKVSNEKLDEAYREASNQVDLISGLLGKENELVKKMRKFRN